MSVLTILSRWQVSVLYCSSERQSRPFQLKRILEFKNKMEMNVRFRAARILLDVTMADQHNFKCFDGFKLISTTISNLKRKKVYI